MPTVTVHFPYVLRPKVGDRATLPAEAATVRELIELLERDFPGIRFNLCDETGTLRTYVNIFVDQDNVRFLQGLDTALTPGAHVRILQSVAGG